MRFGFALPNHWGVEDPEDLLDLAERAEEAGFASVWVAHHILNAGYVGKRLGLKPYWDALTVLSFVATRTERVRLGTSVLVLPYLHPMPVAKQLATIDVMSGGRLDLGVGVGAMPEENEALGIDYHTRGAVADECIDVLKALWADGSASYAGTHYAFEDAVSSPKPLQRPHPPLLIGGNGVPALRRVARCGDGWHPFLLGRRADGGAPPAPRRGAGEGRPQPRRDQRVAARRHRRRTDARIRRGLCGARHRRASHLLQ